MDAPSVASEEPLADTPVIELDRAEDVLMDSPVDAPANEPLADEPVVDKSLGDGCRWSSRQASIELIRYP